MKQTKGLILLGLILSILIIFFLNTLSGIEQKTLVYRPDSYTPYGLKALQLFISKHHYSFHPVIRFQHPSGSGTCLIITADDPISRKSYGEISNWVHAGGTLIELAESKPHFSRQMSERASSTLLTPYFNEPSFRSLRYKLKHRLPFVTKVSVHGFYSLKNRYFIYEEPYGKGKIVSWNDPNGLVNHNLHEIPDHAVIFLKVLQRTTHPGPIDLIDLRYTPKDSSFSLQTFFNHHAVAILLIITGIILGLWKLSSRFGRPHPLVLAKGRSQNEFAIFLAALFQQAGSLEMVLDNFYRALFQTILKVTLLPPDTPSNLAIKRLEEMTGKDYRIMQRISESIETRQVYQNLSRKSFLTFASKIDGYRKELEDWNKFRISAVR